MKAIVVVVNILFIIALFPAAAAAIMSPMTFDAPGSTDKTGLWVFFIATVTLPLVIIIGQVLSWIFFSKQSYKAALICGLLPLLNLFAMAGFFLLGD